MAQVPDSAGVADTSAPTTVPDDYQHIQTNPDMFGAAVARGTQQVAQQGTAISDIWGHVQTDHAVNSAMDSINNSLGQFTALRGGAALDAQASTTADIDGAIKQARDNLLLPEQQLQFDQTMRAYRERYVQGVMRTHADQQGKIYATDVNNSAIQTGLNGVASVAASPDADDVEMFKMDVRDAYVKQVQLEGNGGNPDLVKAAIGRADAAVYKTQAQALSAKDPMAALALVDLHKDVLGTEYQQLSNSFRARAIQEQAPVKADQYLARLGVGPDGGNLAAPPTVVGALVNALHGQESGGAATAPTSAAGAEGPLQIKPATFNEYTLPGERLDITNLDDQKIVASRIVAAGMAKGGSPQAGLVAYYSGIGNVAPPGSPTPWLRDLTPNAGVPGPSVSEYVAQTSARAAKAGALMDKGSILAQVDQDYANDPQMAAAMRAHINQRYAIAQMAIQSQGLAAKDQQDKLQTDYVSQIMSGKSGDIVPKIAADPNLNWQAKENLYDLALKAVRQTGDGDAAHYGSGYFDMLKNLTLPYEDPNRINSVSQIIEAGKEGGPLNGVGVTHLISLYNDRNKEERAGWADVQKNMLSSAKQKLSFEDPSSPYSPKDPTGEAVFRDQFLPYFNKLWNDTVKAGHDPVVTLDNNILDAAIAPFMRTPAQKMQDMRRSYGNMLAPEGDQSTNSVAPAPAGPSFADFSKFNSIEDIKKAMSKNPSRAEYQAATEAARQKGLIVSSPVSQ